MKTFYYLRCIECGKTPKDPMVTSKCPSCSSALDVVYDYDYIKDHLNTYLLQNSPPRVIKYLDFYPLHDRNIVSLNEGGTPLQRAKNLGKKLGLSELYIKNEGLNPTGAFKDRGSFMEINKAKELGYKTTCVASTGNMAASVAAFSAQANLPCYVFVPDNTPRGKLAQCLSYGAHVIQVKGTYAQATVLADATAKKYGFYLAGDYAYRLEGQKSLAFEVSEQLFFQAPDIVIVPIGMGTNISAIWKGFKEYHQFGLIQTLPLMIGVQADGCNPVVKAFTNGGKVVPVAKPNTVSSAIACGNPIDARKALAALKESKGFAISVSDEETLKAQQTLARTEALYVEPASATTIAAVEKLVKSGKIKPHQRVVCVATGAGLKDPAMTLKILAEPPIIEPLIEEVDRILSGKIHTIRSGGVVEREKTFFSKLPSAVALQKTVSQEFGVELDSEGTKRVMSELTQFIKEKGKAVVKADLQTILETTIQEEPKIKSLEVVDFTVSTTKHKRPTADVTARLNGQQFKTSSSGVGPVDAAINALKKELVKLGGINIRLIDYAVEISTAGTDASAEVSMILRDDRDNETVKRATSPDIIVASIEAFERGYNELAGRKKK